MVQAKIDLKYYGGKNKKKVEMAVLIFPSEDFVVITHLLRWSIYMLVTKKMLANPTDLTYPKPPLKLVN